MLLNNLKRERNRGEASLRLRVGPATMATVGLLAVLRLRCSCEPPAGVLLEVALQGAGILFWFARVRHPGASKTVVNNNDRLLMSIAAAMTVVPWLLQFVLRLFGQGAGLELVSMSSLAWPTLLATLAARTRRALGTTVICSGFITLLATCSSDQSVALLIAFLWGGLCLWWLSSAHYERAMRCQVNTVVVARWHRPVTVLVGCSVFLLAAWSVAGRFPSGKRLPWQVAPTSGGTDWQDAHARSGVGDGDAMVAAREHAASFGAVESDLMLESKESSLFDLYSDSFGEPFRKQEMERTVALTPQSQELSQPNRTSQSDGPSSSLTTQRRASQVTKPLTDRAADALLFWIGRPNSHLALERFADFDGLEWTPVPPSSSNFPTRAVEPLTAESKDWFRVRPPLTEATNAIFQGARQEAVKYARLRSPHIPSLAGLHSWHIHQIEDPSFFQVDANDNLTMPGRKSVPEYTIVRYINRDIDLQSLTDQINSFPVASLTNDKSSSSDQATEGTRAARKLVEQWLAVETKSVSRSFERLVYRTSTTNPSSSAEDSSLSRWQIATAIIDRLRREYSLDRTFDSSTCADPLATFLERRAGNDLMFATAAAVMLRELGFQTRLVTGFVARAENRLGWTQELAIYARDTHAWIEVQASAGNWIPLEPSPGYPLPVYRVSWRYWLERNAWFIVMACGCFVLLAVAGYRYRAALFDLVCLSFAVLCWLGNDRQRCQWLLIILDWRCRLIGNARPEHVPPRCWYSRLIRTETASLSQSATIFFREADQLWFGKDAQMSPAGREACFHLWTNSTCRALQSAMGPSQPLRPSEHRSASEFPCL